MDEGVPYTEVVEVSLVPPDYRRFWSWSIDSPQVGLRIDGRSLEIVGWVLGRQVPAVAVECVMGGDVIRAAMNWPRPDLAVAYPDASGAAHAGFRFQVPVWRPPALDIEVRAVLEDGTRFTVGYISVCRRWPISPEPPGEEGSPGLVSVVIPCYNQAHFLSEAIESVLGQTYRRVEVVVVDDGSTDNTSALARRYSQVRCVRQDNQGLARARNNGLRESRGDYLVFLDADDLLLPDALTTGVRALRDHPESAFAFGHTAFLMEGQSEPPVFGQRRAVEADLFRSLLKGCPILATGTVIYRRSLFDQMAAFDPTLSPAADYDLYYRVARTHPVHCHGEVVAVYRRHSGNMTANARTMLRANVMALRRQRRFILARPQYWGPYRRGLRYWQGHLGSAVARQVQSDLRNRHLVRSALGVGALFRWSPHTIGPLLRAGRKALPVETWNPS